MRHGVAGRKFGRTTNQRKALISSLAEAIIHAEHIVTTLPKAKDIRPVIEKLITCGRKGTLAARRKISSFIKDKKAQKKLMEVLGPRYKLRPGGYTRIMKAGFRYGDNAPLAVIEFVDRSHLQENAKKNVNLKKERDEKQEKNPVKSKVSAEKIMSKEKEEKSKK